MWAYPSLSQAEKTETTSHETSWRANDTQYLKCVYLMYRIGILEDRVKKQTVSWWKWWWKWRFGIRIVSESDLSSYNNQSESCMRAWTNKRPERRKCVRCRVMSIVSGTRVWSDFQMRVNTRVITSIVKVWGTVSSIAASWPDSECGEQLLLSCGHWLSVNKYATDRSSLLWIRS